MAKAKRISTGFLISPCYMVTSSHSLQEEIKETPSLEGRTFRFLPHGSEAPIMGEAVEWGHFDSVGRNDWVLGKLVTCIGVEIGWLPVARISGPSLSGKPAVLVGYAGDRPWELLWSNCLFRGHETATDLVLHDCASRPGTSGSPLFSLAGETPRVVAILKGGSQFESAAGFVREWSLESSNTAVSMQQMLANPNVRQRLRTDLKYGLHEELVNPFAGRVSQLLRQPESIKP